MSSIRTIRSLIAVGLAVALAGYSAADVVELSDGSRIIGTVKRFGDGKLILETKFAGTLEIDASTVVRVETDQPVTVEMTTGDRLVGNIAWQPNIQTPVIETDMGGIPIKMEKVQAIWPKGEKAPDILVMEAQIEENNKAMEARRAKWSATLEAGLLFKEGNTDVLEARGAAELRRKGVKDLLRFYISGDYAEQSEKRSRAEVKGGAFYEYNITERVFAFGRFDLEYDEFEDLDLRASVGTGLGYYLLKKPKHELKVRAGLGYLHETYFDGLIVDTAQSEVGADYRLAIAPWVQLTHSANYYPTFEGLDDYRLVFDTALLFPIGDSDKWKFKLGALHEYDSMPRPGIDRLDHTYYANIVLDIK